MSELIAQDEVIVRKAEQTSNVCERCGCECPNGVGMSFANKVFGKWFTWRLCRPCAKAEEELQDARVEAAIAQADRSGT